MVGTGSTHALAETATVSGLAELTSAVLSGAVLLGTAVIAMGFGLKTLRESPTVVASWVKGSITATNKKGMVDQRWTTENQKPFEAFKCVQT